MEQARVVWLDVFQESAAMGGEKHCLIGMASYRNRRDRALGAR